MIVDQKAGHQPGTKDEENQSDSVTQESSSQCSSYIRKALLSQEPERSRASLVAQREKNLPTTWETWVQSLGWEDPWKRKWQPTPVFLPGESHGQRSLVGYSP